MRDRSRGERLAGDRLRYARPTAAGGERARRRAARSSRARPASLRASTMRATSASARARRSVATAAATSRFAARFRGDRPGANDSSSADATCVAVGSSRHSASSFATAARTLGKAGAEQCWSDAGGASKSATSSANSSIIFTASLNERRALWTCVLAPARGRRIYSSNAPYRLPMEWSESFFF